MHERDAKLPSNLLARTDTLTAEVTSTIMYVPPIRVGGIKQIGPRRGFIGCVDYSDPECVRRLPPRPDVRELVRVEAWS
jgi:hypothetical protein